MPRPQIFVSYSHKDVKQHERLMTQLGVLADAADIAEPWSDERISAGQTWQAEIERAMSRAHVAVLLISANFLTSGFILRSEVPKLLKRREREGMRVLPLLAKPCAWQAVSWLNAMQIRPKDAKPIWRSGGRYADAELAIITLEVKSFVESAVLEHKQSAAAKRKQEQALQTVLEQARQQALAIPNAFRDATTIQQELDTDAQQQQMERWQILKDTQSKIFEIMHSKSSQHPPVRDAAYNRWDAYIRGDTSAVERGATRDALDRSEARRDDTRSTRGSITDSSFDESRGAAYESSRSERSESRSGLGGYS